MIWQSQLAPLPVALPLLFAAVLVLFGSDPPRRLLDSICIGLSAAVCAICCILAVRSAAGPIVYWFGGWKPGNGGAFPLGISFVIDPLGAGLAALVSLLVTAAFVFSWSYFGSVGALFHSLMLVFLAAMCGMCLTGDIFNLFVWFELMTATAVTLCGYKSEDYGPLQGALNLAITNTIGAFLTLGGIGFLYAQTGALNMAEIGRSLAAHPPGNTFLLLAFLFVVAGFLVKAAAVPFHFWLADAHAVAPTPVCMLFSGVMVELGLYAITRVYWTVFSTALGPCSAVRDLLLTVGVLTSIVGAMQCTCQRHLKRLLAFSTISHMGIMFCGIALLTAQGITGTGLYVLGHGLLKGGLFACAGILLHRFKKVDEYALQGVGRSMPYTGILVGIGALGLAGLPPFGNFFGGSIIEEAARDRYPWLPWVFVFASAMTAAAVLRLGARVFLGWGEPQPASDEGEQLPPEEESGSGDNHTPACMWGAAAALLLMSMLIGIPTPIEFPRILSFMHRLTVRTTPREYRRAIFAATTKTATP